MKKYNARIINKGCSYFLNPPTYPERRKCVFLEDWHPDGHYCCLSNAVDWKQLDKEIRKEAKRILDSWQKPDINDPRIQKWIKKVMKVYGNRYRGDTTQPFGGFAWCDLVKNDKLDPVENQDLHGGVYFIRKYYPEFILKKHHLK